MTGMIDEGLRDQLDELFAAGLDHDQRETDHRRRRLNLETPSAELLALLVRVGRRTRILELGTSNGYSTIWLAWAAAPCGGRVTTIDQSPEKHDQARRNLEAAGLADAVELRTGEIGAVLAELEGPFDLVFLDADRPHAAGHLAALEPRLAPDVLLVADNVDSHPQELAAYLDALAERPAFRSTFVHVGKGLHLAHRAAV
jgi:predicted O-methyltransferase YrrM